MRKIAVFMAVIIIISMPLTVSAATNALEIDPYLTFSGTTATCDVMVVGNNTSEHIQVTMKLMYGSTCVASWSDSGYGYVYMLEYAGVTKGRTYELIVAVTVNDVAKTPVSVSGTC
jgi:hypothetical protein